MGKMVASGNRATRNLPQRGRMSGITARTHQADQAVCRLGKAAYWLDTSLTGPDEKFHRPPIVSMVSTKWEPAGSRRGGRAGKNEKPIRARPVVRARVFRHRRYRCGKRKNSSRSTKITATK